VKIFSKVTVPAKEDMQLTAVKCDNCNAEAAKPGYSEHSPSNWEERSFYDVNQVIISHKVGSSLPEGSSGEQLLVDLCPELLQEDHPQGAGDSWREVRVQAVRLRGATNEVQAFNHHTNRACQEAV
jgi:hypothetical protein